MSNTNPPSDVPPLVPLERSHSNTDLVILDETQTNTTNKNVTNPFTVPTLLQETPHTDVNKNVDIVDTSNKKEPGVHTPLVTKISSPVGKKRNSVVLQVNEEEEVQVNQMEKELQQAKEYESSMKKEVEQR